MKINESMFKHFVVDLIRGKTKQHPFFFGNIVVHPEFEFEGRVLT
jgi:hypothetical protein